MVKCENCDGCGGNERAQDMKMVGALCLCKRCADFFKNMKGDPDEDFM